MRVLRGLLLGTVNFVSALKESGLTTVDRNDCGTEVFYPDQALEKGASSWLTSQSDAPILQVTSVFSAFVAYPFDTVRHRLMMQSGELSQVGYALSQASAPVPDRFDSIGPLLKPG